MAGRSALFEGAEPVTLRGKAPPATYPQLERLLI